MVFKLKPEHVHALTQRQPSSINSVLALTGMHHMMETYVNHATKPVTCALALRTLIVYLVSIQMHL